MPVLGTRRFLCDSVFDFPFVSVLSVVTFFARRAARRPK